MHPITHSVRTAALTSRVVHCRTAAAMRTTSPCQATLSSTGLICSAGFTAAPTNMGIIMDNRNHYHYHHHCVITVRGFAKFQKNKASDAAAAKSKKSDASSSSSSSPGYGFSDADFTAARSKDLDLLIAALNAPMRQEPPITDVEKARRHEIGRNYVIGRFQQHNAIYHDLACKIQMKKHAVNMLPKQSKLKEAAMMIDDQGPPPWRHLAAWTPPIPGYDPNEFVEKEEE